MLPPVLRHFRYKKSDGQGLAVSSVSLSGATNQIQVVELDGLETSTFDVSLPADAVGKRLILETVSLTGKKERRVSITRLAFVSGYSKGMEQPVFFRGRRKINRYKRITLIQMHRMLSGSRHILRHLV